jgi:hypothetical protein
MNSDNNRGLIAAPAPASNRGQRPRARDRTDHRRDVQELPAGQVIRGANTLIA